MDTAERTSPYQNLLLYYISGTGNALMATRWMAENAQGKIPNIQILPIDRIEKVEPQKVEGDTLIGFLSPTHGFSLPWLMLKFIFRFPRMKNADFFLLNTRAGMKMYKVFFPGLSGIAQLLPLLVLILKGYKLKGLLPLDMPSNWISLHPGIRQKVVDSIVKRCNGIVNRFCSRVFYKKHYYHYWVFVEFPLDMLIAPISIGYFFFGRFFLAKTFVASYQCNGCRLCEQKCPVNAIEFRNNRPYWTFDCESCMRCMNFCPHRAIETSYLNLILTFVITAILPLAKWFEDLFFPFLKNFPVDIRPMLDFFIFWTYFLLVIFLIYIFTFLVTKNKYVSIFLNHLTPTKYKFWRRYKAPGIKAKDFPIPKIEEKVR